MTFVERIPMVCLQKKPLKLSGESPEGTGNVVIRRALTGREVRPAFFEPRERGVLSCRHGCSFACNRKDLSTASYRHRAGALESGRDECLRRSTAGTARRPEVRPRCAVDRPWDRAQPAPFPYPPFRPWQASGWFF